VSFRNIKKKLIIKQGILIFKTKTLINVNLMKMNKF